jgi:hypothetical protein
MLRFLVAFLLFAFPATAQTFSGLWWDPNKAGEGMSVQQDGYNIFLVWYAYSANGSPIWYAGSGALVPSSAGLIGSTLTGNLNSFSATAASNTAGFNVAGTASVGTFVLTLNSETQITFEAVTSAALGSLPLTLQPYNVAIPDATGTFAATVSELASTCGAVIDPTFQATYTITQNGTAITLTETRTTSSDVCTFVAPSSTVLGNKFTFPVLQGSCTAGDSAVAANATLIITANTMLLNAVSTVTSPGQAACSVTQRVVGAR